MTRRTEVTLALLGLVVAEMLFLARVYGMNEGRYSLYDDAFISFRYARNLARGDGLVFNVGDIVEGYTNFLWTVVLAVTIRLGSDPIVASKILGIGSGVLVIGATWLIASRLTDGVGLWRAIPPLLLASTASLPRFALSGMETLGFMLWVSLGLWLESVYRRPLGSAIAALLFAIAAITRPEGALFFIVFTVATFAEMISLGENRGTVIRALLVRVAVFCSIFLPYYIWRFSFYGYPMPNTFYAKVGGLSVAALVRGLSYLYSEMIVLNLPMFLWGTAGLFAFRRKGIRPIAAALLAYSGYLLIIGGDDWAVFGPRFIMIIFPSLTIFGVLGMRRLLPKTAFVAAILPAAAIALTAGLSVFEATAYGGVVHTMNRGWWTAAEWLSTHTDRRNLLAVDAAGIMPYFSDLPTLDMLGLNDLHIAHTSTQWLGSGVPGHEKFDPAYVLQREPDYIASWLNDQGRPISAGLAAAAQSLQGRYELAAVFLMGRPLPSQPIWLDVRDIPYTRAMHQGGYIYGIFIRRPETALGKVRLACPCAVDSPRSLPLLAP